MLQHVAMRNFVGFCALRSAVTQGLVHAPASLLPGIPVLEYFLYTPTAHGGTTVFDGAVVKDFEAAFLVEGDVLFGVGEKGQFAAAVFADVLFPERDPRMLAHRDCRS